jgi:septal ring factor EnvC (AmiA/AmiB activator)
MTGLVTGIGLKLALGGVLGKIGAAIKGAAAFIVAHWKAALIVAAIVAPVIYALICLHREHAAEANIPVLQQAFANERKAFQAERQAFATEQASLAGARTQIDDTNKRVMAQAADLELAKHDAAAADARNASLARSTDSRIAALQAAAGKHGAPCTLSDGVKKELENQ